MPKKLTHLLLVVFLSFVFLVPGNEIYARYTRSVRVKLIKPTASKQIVILPTNTPTPTVSPTISVTKTPIPTKSPVKPIIHPSENPNVTESKSLESTHPTNEKRDYIMQKINEYRKSQGISEVKTDSQTCSFARIRAEEISKNFNHEGFRSRIDSKTLPYSGYLSVTENIAMNSDHTKVVESWINSSGHAENMRKDTPFVCVENFGNYYAYEGMRL